MKSVLKDLVDFHALCAIPILRNPQFPAEDRRKLRDDLLEEEYREYKEAREANDMVEFADAIGDMIYILVGTALEHGISLDRVWSEIQRSNMAKADPATGTVKRREDGKILKPASWTPPDIEKAISVPLADFLDAI